MKVSSSHNQEKNHEARSNDHAEISIWLDSYDDMFSDFDPRPYSKRTVSDDFIIQTRKVARDRYGNKITLQLLLPESKRSKEKEEIITRRLQEYFQWSYNQLQTDKQKNLRRGYLLTFAGTALLIIAGYLSLINPQSYILHLLMTLFEPAGWFMLWMGLELLFYLPGKTQKELAFHTNMMKARIEFKTYE
jgi:hypothetical protein